MKPWILLTGATGYIGGRLLKLLEAEGRPVRCLTRRPEFLQGRIAPGSEVVAGDVLDADSLRQAMNGMYAAYYLVHSMVVFEPGRTLRLSAEMKLPGRAWLEFEVTADADGSLIRQTAIFDPAGLGGLMYWYLVYPLHQLVFGGMLRGIAHAVEHPPGKI